MNKKQDRTAHHALLFLFLGMTMFGSGTPVSKLVTQDFPPMLASGIRMAIAGLVLLPFALRESENGFRTLLQLTRKDWLPFLGVALIGNVAFSLFMLYGMNLVSGVVGSVVMSTTPAVTATASVIFLKESLNKVKIAALILSLAGVIIINVSSGGTGGGSGLGTLIIGSLLVFGAVCSEATYTLLGKVATDHLPPVKLVTLSALLATAMFLPLAIWQAVGFDWTGAGWGAWSALGWWGAGTMGLGSLLWFNGVKSVPGHIAAVFMAVMPVSALVLSYMLLGEPFQWIHLGGFLVTFCGVLLIIREQAKAMQDGD